MDSLATLPVVETPLTPNEVDVIKRYFTPSGKPATVNTVAQDGSLLKALIIITTLHVILSSGFVNKMGQKYNPWLIMILKTVVFAFAVFLAIKFV
jgi:hypothetical protein